MWHSVSLRKTQLLNTKNFALYYGVGKTRELSNFDIAIVESKGQSLTNIEAMKKEDTLVFVYQSILEVHPSEPVFEKLSKADFLLDDGQPIRNENFGTYLVSLKSKTWISYLLEEIKHKLERLEADGIFMDTIGSIEMQSIPPKLRESERHSITNFLHVLRLLYPYALFIQNSGVEQVCTFTKPYIDGICWENPPFSLKESEEWCEVILKRLKGYQDNYDIRVFFLYDAKEALTKESYPIAKTIAQRNHFLLYEASNNYVDGVAPM